MRFQLEQVVMTLAANARVPEVTDTGKGISDEHLPHIFKPFYTTKESGKGTGLGLATVYGIVKRWIYLGLQRSRHRNDFQNLFPAYKPRSFSKPKPETSESDAELRGSETLLLVEDESAVRHPASEFLKKCGYKVIEARDGLQAIEAAGKYSGKIDLMVTDVVMPGMSGGQVAELLADSHREMKVLFVSGYAERVVQNHPILAAHTNFLQKPFTLASLARKIREVLSKKEAAAASVSY